MGIKSDCRFLSLSFFSPVIALKVVFAFCSNITGIMNICMYFQYVGS